MDELLAVWLFALAIGLYAGLVRRTQDLLHPLALFVVGWIGVFAFAHLDVPRTYDEPYYALPFGTITYLAVLAGGVSFTIGFWLGDQRFLPLERLRIWPELQHSVRRDRLAVATLVLFAIAATTTVFFIRTAGEIPLFSPRIGELRRTFKLRYWGYLYDLHYPVVLFSVMLASWSDTRSGRMRWLALAGCSVLMLMSGGVRVAPLSALAWAFVFVSLRPRGLRVRHLVAAAVVFVAIFGVIEWYRTGQFVGTRPPMNERLDTSSPATAWAHSAASFKNLQLTIEQVESPLYMGLTSYDLPKTISPAWRSVDQQINALYGTHNTPTFLGFLYFDFGWAGILIMPGIYGVLTALVYRRLRRAPTVFWLVVYIDFLLASVLAFRTHRFLGNNLLYFALVAFAVELIAGRRRSAAPDQPAGTPVGDPALAAG